MSPLEITSHDRLGNTGKLVKGKNFTGQNPASSRGVEQQVLAALKQR